MKMEQRYREVEDMPVYQLLYALALDVERDTRCFGPDFGWLRTQILRSSESAFVNMAEGFYSQYSTEYLQSLFRSRREEKETEKHLKYAQDVGQLALEAAQDLLERYGGAARQVRGLISSIERKISIKGKAKPGYHVVRESGEEYVWRDEEVPSAFDHPPSAISHSPSAISH